MTWDVALSLGCAFLSVATTVFTWTTRHRYGDRCQARGFRLGRASAYSEMGLVVVQSLARDQAFTVLTQPPGPVN